MIPGNSFNKDLVLSWLMHHLPMQTRHRLSAELPAAYNDVVQQYVMTAMHSESVAKACAAIKATLGNPAAVASLTNAQTGELVLALQGLEGKQ